MKSPSASVYRNCMYKAVLTLLVGLMLSQVGTNGAFAKGDVIWEGTQEPKYSLFGKKIKKLIITTEGVFIDGLFTQASKLRLEQACLYGMPNFPKNKWYISGVGQHKRSSSWQTALFSLSAFSGESGQTCDAIKTRAQYDFIFKSKKIKQTNRKNSEPSISSTQTASIVRNLPKELWKWTDRDICRKAKLPSTFGGWQPVDGAMGKYVVEAKRRGLNCGPGDIASAAKAPSIPNSKDRDIEVLCSLATKERNGKVVWGLSVAYVKEAKRRGLSCGVGESVSTQTASANSSAFRPVPREVRLIEIIVSVYIPGPMEPVIAVNGRIIRCMGKGLL